MHFAGQHRGANDLSALRLNKTAQVRQRTSLTNEVIDQKVIQAWYDITRKGGLMCQAGKTVCAGVPNHIALHDGSIDG